MEFLLALATIAIVGRISERWMPRAVIKAVIVAYVVIPLVATGYAIWLLWDRWIGWTELTLFITMSLATGLGTTLGFHRLLTHRSFDTAPAVKAFFLILGTMALPTRCIDWAANHLKHHAYSDREGDPHSPLEGLFHAHIGWIFDAAPAERERYCKHLLDDPVVTFIDRTSMLWFSLGLLVPFLVGGWTGLLWGGFVRIAYGNHVTYAVNSICHTFGAQPFATNDESRNNWLIGLLALGEGWHNNHHAFPGMACHGMKWWQFDLTGIVIRLLARMRLAWNVKYPSPHLVERRRRPTAIQPRIVEG